MVRRQLNHNLRPEILRSPRNDRAIREALCHSYLRRCEIRLSNHLRLLPRRFPWSEALPLYWNHHPIHLRSLHRYLPNRRARHYFITRESAIFSRETRWHRRHRHDLLLRRWLGFGLELHPISHRSGDLPSSREISWNVHDHVLPFRESIRKLESRASHASYSVSRLES